MGVGSYCEGEVVRTGQYSIQQLKRVEILKQIQLPMIIQSHVISKTYKLCSPQVTTSGTRSCSPEQSCHFTTSPKYPERAAGVKQPSVSCVLKATSLGHWTTKPTCEVSAQSQTSAGCTQTFANTQLNSEETSQFVILYTEGKRTKSNLNIPKNKKLPSVISESLQGHHQATTFIFTHEIKSAFFFSFFLGVENRLIFVWVFSTFVCTQK